MERLLDVTQTAEILGIKPVTLRLWISLKKIPYYKVGKSIKFKPSEIEAWVDATRVESARDLGNRQNPLSDVIRNRGRRHSDLNKQSQKEVKDGAL